MTESPLKGKIALIANPESGGGAGHAKLREFLGILRAKKLQFDTFVTKAPGEAIEFGKQVKNAGFDCVLVLGGDGTLSEAAKGLYGSELPIGAVPSGSGNDMAGALGIPRDLSKALEVLMNSSIVPLDIFKDGETIYIETIGCGFVADVVAKVLKLSRYIHGSPAYLAAVFDTLASFKFSDYTVKIDDEVWEGSASLIIINNSFRVGGGMKLTPEAKLDDGLLDIGIVKTTSKLKLVSLLPKAYSGGHVYSDCVTIKRGKKFSVRAERELVKTADGEIVGTLPIEVEILPASMNFFRAKS